MDANPLPLEDDEARPPQGSSTGSGSSSGTGYYGHKNGHYSDLGYSHRTQKMLKYYCLLVPWLWLCLKLLRFGDYTNLMVSIILCIFFCNYLVTISNDGTILTNYFTVITVDENQEARKMYFMMEKIFCHFPILLLLEVLKFSLAIFINFKFYPYEGTWGLILVNPFEIYSVFGRYSVTMIFALLYCRVKSFRMMLISETSRKLDKNLILKSYIAICRSLEETGFGPKLLITANTAISFIGFIMICYTEITLLRNKDTELLLSMAFITCLCLAIDYFILFFPSFVLELVSQELEQCHVYIADQIVTCTDLRKRSDFYEILTHIKSQPLDYSVWRVVPINANLLLTFMAVAVDYLICMLQVTRTINSSYFNATQNSF